MADLRVLPRHCDDSRYREPLDLLVDAPEAHVLVACHTNGVGVNLLEREMHTEAAAARLLRVAPSTLHWWLEGRPPRYRPVIRPEPTGSRAVTWAEFVEAGLLRSYRRDHAVPLKELRDFIDALRDKFQAPFPLADRRPYVGPGRKLLIDLPGPSSGAYPARP